jgi:serine/threonine protein kinase
MELVEGDSLAKRISGTPQHPAAAASIVEVLAQAMEAAHRHGIVHRVLKPANVLLQISDCGLQIEEQSEIRNLQSEIRNLQSAIPKIADFGLAKFLNEDQSLTQSQGVLGTPSYMAPEQATERHGEIGPAADIYALGAILYELLTGRPPFRGPTILETLDLVRNQEPVPPRRLQPGIARDLETICLKCLEKQPRKRYGTAEALATDLRCLREGKPITARPVGRVEVAWKWARRRPALAGLVAVSTLLVAGLVAALVWDNVRTQGFVEMLQDENFKTERARADAVFQAGVAKQR